MLEYTREREAEKEVERINFEGEDIGKIWPMGWGYPKQDGYQCRILSQGKEYLPYVGGVGRTKNEAIAVARGKAMQDIEALQKIVELLDRVLQ